MSSRIRCAESSSRAPMSGPTPPRQRMRLRASELTPGPCRGQRSGSGCCRASNHKKKSNTSEPASRTGSTSLSNRWMRGHPTGRRAAHERPSPRWKSRSSHPPRSRPRRSLGVGRSPLRERQSNTMVLWADTRTRWSRCHCTARDSTTFSTSRPFAIRSSIWSRCETRATSCSMIGPSSRTSVT